MECVRGNRKEGTGCIYNEFKQNNNNNKKLPKSVMKGKKSLYHSTFLFPVAMWIIQAEVILHTVKRFLKTWCSFVSGYILTIRIIFVQSCSKQWCVAHVLNWDNSNEDIRSKSGSSDFTALLTESTGRREASSGPPTLCIFYWRAGLETNWEECGGSDSRVQNTMRKGNPNINITPWTKVSLKSLPV